MDSRPQWHLTGVSMRERSRMSAGTRLAWRQTRRQIKDTDLAHYRSVQGLREAVGGDIIEASRPRTNKGGF